MLLTALEQAQFDDLVDKLDDPNLLGFARRIPESRHYRRPPVGCPSDIPMPQAVREHFNSMKARASRLTV